MHRVASLTQLRNEVCGCRREHFVQDQDVKEARAALDAFAEDHAVLTLHMHMNVWHEKTLSVTWRLS